nr:hypothetical protein [Tanacetum cinerariifolium]
PVFVPEFEHPEDLVPAEDEAPASLLPQGFLSPRIRPLSPRALGAEMNAIASFLYHSLHPSGTPPLLPIPLSTPSTSRRAGIFEADTPPQNKPLLATPRPGCKVEESSAAAMRRPGPTMAHRVDCSYVETRLQDTEKVDKYISGLPDNIYGNAKSSKPKTLDETIEVLATPMLLIIEATMSQTLGEMGTGNTNATNNRGDNEPNPRGNGCFECGNPGRFKRDCHKLKNKNRGNGNAQGWVYAVGNAKRNGNATRNPDSNVVMGTFLLNNRYASILFDTGADRSFVSTAFSSLIDIIPTPLDNHYDVELADGKIVGINTIIRGRTLNFLNHPFTIDLMPIELGSFDAVIDLMPIELGSFDAIIGMDWLRRHLSVIVCDEKLVRVPFGNEILVFRGAESYIGKESRLTVISCSKVQEYMTKGCLPPARPIEFQIDLFSGAAPVA